MKGSATEPNVILETAEFVNNTWITINGRFRVYESWAESVEAHAQLLAYGVDWDPTLYHKVLGLETTNKQHKPCKMQGMPPTQPMQKSLFKMIEEHELYKYDQLPTEETTVSVRKSS